MTQEHAHDASITLNYTEAALVMACIDHAIAHSPALTDGSKRFVRPLVDRMAATFGFPTARIDRMLKGQRVKVEPNAF